MLLPILLLAGMSLKLNLHEVREIQPGVQLQLEAVEDSRCPKGAQCIQEGKLAYRLRLTADKLDTPILLGRHLPAWQGQGLRIQLQASAAEPDRPILHAAPPAYFVTLDIQPSP